MTTPTLLLRPGGSRDRSGPMTPTEVGTVTTTAGQYGDAWDLSGDGYLTFPTANHVTPARGTILMRVQCPALSDIAMLYDAHGTRHRVFLSSGRTITTRFGPTSRASGLTLTQNTPHVVGARWGGGRHQAVLDTTFGPVFEDEHGSTVEATARLGRSLSGTFPFPGLIESVLLYDTKLSDGEITEIASMPEAWTWDNATFPERTVFPVLTPGPRPITMLTPH